MSPRNPDQLVFFTSDSEIANTLGQYLDSIGMSNNLLVTNDLRDVERILGSGAAHMMLADHSIGRKLVLEGIKTRNNKDKEIPFVLITNKNMQSAIPLLIESGVDDYITLDNLLRLEPVIRRELKAYKEVIAGRKAKQEIKELLTIIESAEDEIYIIGEESSKIKFANNKAQSNLGYSIEELYGLNFENITEGGLPIEISRRKDDKSRVMTMTKFIRKDGTRYPAEVIFQKSETNDSTSVLAIAHDITEKETAKKHAFVLNKAIDASASAVTVIDENQNIVYANETQISAIGKDRNDIIGKHIVSTGLYEACGTDFFDALENCKLGKNWVGEYQKIDSTGKECIVLGSVSPVLNDGLTEINIIIVEEDITENVRIRSQLLHAQKMETVGELTSGIAHDFTNMLTAIGGFASIMKRKMDKEEQFYNYIEKISDITIRAKSLTKNLLTFSRKQIQADRVICTNNLIKTVCEFLSMVIGSKIEMKINLTDENVNIVGDPVQLEQVIINLSTNARDAITDNGVLEITTSKSNRDGEEFVEIRVKDNGVGIDHSKVEMIFEPFYTTKEEGKGTGLGLYMVSDIISRHNGCITCTSEVDVGTEFTILLPMTDQVPEVKCDTAEVTEGTDAVTILLAEDEKVVRDGIKHALGAYGYEILEAGNGLEALELFKTKHEEIDVLVTDIMMPVMSGVTAYNEMVKIKPSLRAIFATGYIGEAQRKEGFNEDEHTVMMKPLVIKDLVKTIEGMTKNKG
jgi:PAS domain S-box-containing protein